MKRFTRFLSQPYTVAAMGAAVFWLAFSPTHTVSAAKVKTSAEAYKNIQVLKKLPVDQLIPIMRRFNEALGVRCDFCHVIKEDHTGFERDDKPEKRIARKMIIMTNKLNRKEKILKNKATCFMCHHGHPEPQTNPSPEEKPAEPTPQP